MGWPSSTGVIRNIWHGCWFRSAHRFFDGGTIFTVSAKLRERIRSENYIIIKAIYVMDVTFFADLKLSGIVCNLITYPSQVL